MLISEEINSNGGFSFVKKTFGWKYPQHHWPRDRRQQQLCGHWKVPS